jgi:hypothetical protein
MGYSFVQNSTWRGQSLPDKHAEYIGESQLFGSKLA